MLFSVALSVVLIIVGPSPQESASIDFTSVVSLSFWPVSLFQPSTFSDILTSLLRVYYNMSLLQHFPSKFPKSVVLGSKKRTDHYSYFQPLAGEDLFSYGLKHFLVQETCMLCFLVYIEDVVVVLEG